MGKIEFRLSTVLSVLTFLIGFSVFDGIPKYIIIVLTAICLLVGFNFDLWFKKHIKLNALVFIFCVATIAISYLNRNQIQTRNVFYASIVFAVIILELILAVEYIAEHGKINEMINIYFYFSLILVIINDVLILLKGKSGFYFLGNKFGVSFFHLYLFAFFCMYAKKHKKRINMSEKDEKCLTSAIYVALFLVSALVIVSVDCMTGVIGLLILVLMLFMVKRFAKTFYNRITLFITFSLSYAFMWVHNIILNNQYIYNFITDTLDTSATLTGRTIIFDAIPDIMNGHWLIGYGYGSAYEICDSKIGYADAQNGLMQIILQIGIIGTAAMLIWVLYAMRKRNGNIAAILYAAPIASLIYMNIFLGTVEITYDTRFLLLFMILYGIFYDSKISASNEQPENNTSSQAVYSALRQ